ncbi:hypothetical protein CARUB_v10019118mg [Capsella rubella]|uniref:Uncharacterized protein n=1 Tax=Capsella rubella TaxID=81985 RepID=R0FSE4_9BRAS|nr:hypothetical protein CARUB_v10019118mg [Capsella rubella]
MFRGHGVSSSTLIGLDEKLHNEKEGMMLNYGLNRWRYMHKLLLKWNSTRHQNSKQNL